jgi:predicted nucleic acid-binding protein
MKVIVDLNIVLDVLQKREPFYETSAKVLSLALEKKLDICLPAHALTTIYYIIHKVTSKPQANSAIEWLVEHFKIAVLEKATFLTALALSFNDFEDAVVVGSALHNDCVYVVTRNLKDFKQSVIPAISPETLLTFNGLE